MFSGANKNDYNIGGIDFQRDVNQNAEICGFEIVNLRRSAECDKKSWGFNAIELGHIFKLGTKYSESMGAKFIDEKKRRRAFLLLGEAMELELIVLWHASSSKHHDDKGIIWENPLAPFDVHW